VSTTELLLNFVIINIFKNMEYFTRTFTKKSSLQETVKRHYQQQGIVRFEYSKFSAILMIVTVFFTLP